MSAPDLSYGLEEEAALISVCVGGWHDFGYETPPTPSCRSIPPLGERSAAAIEAGYNAIKAIDELSRQLHALRSQLVNELREDQAARGTNQCGRCGKPVDRPGQSRPDGQLSERARFCEACIDRCHEATDFAHICQLCASPEEAARNGWKVNA